MARVFWPLVRDRPSVEITLQLAATGAQVKRTVLADTGAGTAKVDMDLVLEQSDCLLCGGIPLHSAALGGAYSGSFPVYLIRVQIPSLGFDHNVHAVGVPTVPPGLDGIACFRFLNRFTYGNFGNPAQFGLEI
jgi:hypothetical protein